MLYVVFEYWKPYRVDVVLGEPVDLTNYQAE
jgi:hypothetical protein